MPKKLKLVLICILALVVAGGGYLVLTSKQDRPTPTTNSTQANTDQSSQNEQSQQSSAQNEAQPTEQQSAGTYIDYSADSLANTKGTRVLFFHAPWCPQCRALDASIKSGSIPANVTIFKVDYDTNQKLRQQYGVTIQTTLVSLDSAGNQAKKYVAYDQPTLAALIKNVL